MTKKGKKKKKTLESGFEVILWYTVIFTFKDKLFLQVLGPLRWGITDCKEKT